MFIFSYLAAKVTKRLKQKTKILQAMKLNVLFVNKLWKCVYIFYGLIQISILCTVLFKTCFALKDLTVNAHDFLLK